MEDSRGGGEGGGRADGGEKSKAKLHFSIRQLLRTFSDRL